MCINLICKMIERFIKLKWEKKMKYKLWILINIHILFVAHKKVYKFKLKLTLKRIEGEKLYGRKTRERWNFK